MVMAGPMSSWDTATMIRVQKMEGQLPCITAAPRRSGNEAPVAIPGANQLVVDTDNSFSETVTLDGNQSLDPDGSIVADP